ncbi:MAG: DUF3343 domain-containing protein [Peptoclostridium sp.]|uniref:DUF3343 domain-containing protein n=1 Tax=Peptoclostridium sp. TaxID=1904860 RepID=UPI00139C48C3|nr:DUF3343 domain-containing protein [Peptoclostridium sp.]MZQ76245.1 DUF3343 domain-containing protein [Peptoclostridium sp.]
MEAESKSFVLFPSHMHGLSLEKKLKENGIKYAISPTPRELSSCCGISIMISSADVEDVERILSENPSIKADGIHTIRQQSKKRFFDF